MPLILAYAKSSRSHVEALMIEVNMEKEIHSEQCRSYHLKSIHIMLL